MLRSMLSGRLKRNLKRCSTLSALRVESALSLRPKTSWNKVSAVLLAPERGREHMKEGYSSLAYTQIKSILPVSLSAWVAMVLLYELGQIPLIRTRPWTTIKKFKKKQKKIRAAGQIIHVFPTLCPALAKQEKVRHWGELGMKACQWDQFIYISCRKRVCLLMFHRISQLNIQQRRTRGTHSICENGCVSMFIYVHELLNDLTVEDIL